jgi:hypothetical protein
VTMRICCSECPAVLHKGMLLAPPRIDTEGQAAPTRKSVFKACALGTVATPVDDRDTLRHGQLLYFSRNTGKHTEVGVLVWVVDQSLVVVEIDDMTEVCAEEKASYEFTSCNSQCESHQLKYPRPCSVCAKSISDEKSATTVEKITGPVLTPTLPRTLLKTTDHGPHTTTHSVFRFQTPCSDAFMPTCFQ